MARNLVIAPGEFYHIYNRGVEKRDIFTIPSDYDRFVSMLYICNGTESVHLQRQGLTLTELFQVERGQPLVDIGAYCLMPNHFHLLLKEHAEGGVAKFMQKITTGYTMYFNKRHERSGSLFQGTYKSTHANEDRYLSYLISYIHLNPVKLIEPLWKETGIADKKRSEEYLENYGYSSYLDYLGKKRPENSIINREAFPDYFETPSEFSKSVKEWLGYHQ